MMAYAPTASRVTTKGIRFRNNRARNMVDQRSSDRNLGNVEDRSAVWPGITASFRFGFLVEGGPADTQDFRGLIHRGRLGNHPAYVFGFECFQRNLHADFEVIDVRVGNDLV